MSTTPSGLSRRRVVNTSGVTSDESSLPTTPTVGDSDHRQLGNGHAGTALEGGSKVAYDPEEESRSESQNKGRSGLKVPRLNLTEEVVLVGLKDKAGYLSFWNDSISYALRGCIMLELALRRRIAVVNTPRRRQLPLSERIVEVVDERMTGETLLDEALKLIREKGREGEKLSVNTWIDLMSGETWNVMKISYQLKQVRERIQKGLVDKGLLTTSKTNFLLFDMATHPCTPGGINSKSQIVQRINALLFSKTTAIPPTALIEDGYQHRVMRAVALVASTYAASVLENALGQSRAFEEKEEALTRCDSILSAFSTFPFLDASSTPNTATASRRRQQQGSGSTSDGREAVAELAREATKELQLEGGETWDLYGEVVGAVFEIWGRMDSII